MKEISTKLIAVRDIELSYCYSCAPYKCVIFDVYIRTLYDDGYCLEDHSLWVCADDAKRYLVNSMVRLSKKRDVESVLQTDDRTQIEIKAKRCRIVLEVCPRFVH